jgi:hypothetical protein
MNFLRHDELPLNPDVNCGCNEDAEPTEFQPSEEFRCGFCSLLLSGECCEYTSSDGGCDVFYLCTKCVDRGIDLCHRRLKFYSTDELVTLNGKIKVHESEKDIILSYQSVSDKREYLDITGIDPDGFDLQLVTISANRQESS